MSKSRIYLGLQKASEGNGAFRDFDEVWEIRKFPNKREKWTKKELDEIVKLEWKIHKKFAKHGEYKRYKQNA